MTLRFAYLELTLKSAKNHLLHRLKYQYCGFLTADRLRRDIKTVELGHEERSARTGSGFYFGDHIAVVEVLLLVDVDPARRCVRSPVPTSAGHVDALEVGVVIHAIHCFWPGQALNLLARQAVVDGHLRRSPRADK